MIDPNDTTLLIAIEAGGRAVPLARVVDPNLLRRAARAVIIEKNAEARQLRRADAGLGAAAEQEAATLRRILERAIPGFSGGRHRPRTVGKVIAK